MRASPVLSVKTYGATFSVFFANQMGIDWRAAYVAMLDELNIRNIRIPVYWNLVEPTADQFDFTDTDWMVREAEKRQANVILAIGQKLPRWPECHISGWARNLQADVYQKQLLRYIARVVERYRDSPAVKIWQVENEPFLNFGECPPLNEKLLDAEIAAVRAISAQPIMITDSGELSYWVPSHKRADVFGSTLYRIIWSPILGNFTYPLPASFFRIKRSLAELFDKPKPAVVIELQAEPWQHKMLYETATEDQLKIMNPDKFRETLAYASQTGFDTFYLWGVEWWYWLKTKHNMPAMWDTVKTAVQSVSAK